MTSRVQKRMKQFVVKDLKPYGKKNREVTRRIREFRSGFMVVV